MRLLVLLILLIPQVAFADLYAKYAILDYSNSTGSTMAWINSNFKMKVAGNNPNSSLLWVGYYDIYGPSGITELLKFKDWALANSVVSENALLHYKIDYTANVSPAWSLMDKFDNFEGAKGVMRTADDVSYTDLTATAYSGNVTWQNTVYVGYEEPFDQINLVLSTAGVGITRAWEYWNGSTWSALTVTDGTSSFTSSGQVAFTPPLAWARKVVNGSRSKYFVRCRITAASTNPVTSSVTGDSWLRGGSNLCRGWDATSGSIVNTGELTYNPTPPAGASAKFPYQARITYWSNNHFIADPSDTQAVGRTWAQFLAYRVNQLATENGWSGIMGDDGQRSLSNESLSVTSSDFPAESVWATESLAKYTDFVNAAHALNASLKIGLNGQTKTYVNAGDWNLAEYHTSTWISGGLDGNGDIASSGSTAMAYDDYIAGGKFALLIYADTVDTVPNKTAVWDRANRGPLVALSKHLIAANPNTYFAYYTKGGYVYSETDDVVLKSGSTVHLASQTPALADVKRWATWFPAMGVNVGTPDAGGWNGGARSFTWKLGSSIGGGANVWRRDYTNAIVLHRPAMWNTTDSQYNTYSDAFDLGGTYYPLSADGTTGAAVTTLALRTGEGAILMKAPIGETPQTTHRSLIGRLSGRIR